MKKNIFFIPLLVCAGLVISCNSRNDIDRAPSSFMHISSSIDPSLQKQVQAKISAHDPVYISANDILKMQDDIMKGNSLSESNQIDIRVILYRFYNQIKVEDNKIISTAKSGAEIGIPEDVFQLYNEDIERLNEEMVDFEHTSGNLEVQLESYLRQLKGD